MNNIQIENNKETFLSIIDKNIHREGIFDLVGWLKVSDFFEAPCSTKHHLAVPGGLCAHSLNVYYTLRQLVNAYAPYKNYSEETIAIVALFHDVCKINYYRSSWDGGHYNYTIDDVFPIGHGEKSVILLQQYLKLVPEEVMAIRWHMGAYDVAFQGGSKAYNDATEMSPLVTLLQCADQIAARVLE